MGTSTSNPGPKGRPPLLPPWAPPPDEGPEDGPPDDADAPGDANAGDDQGQDDGDGDVAGNETRPETAPLTGQPTWNSVRRLVGSTASGRVAGERGRDNVRRGVQRSVGAMGGGRAAAQSAVAGRQTAGRFATFLSGIAAGGITEAARSLGIAEHLGRSADVFLMHLADALAPAGALTEDAIARDAMDATLIDLYRQLNVDAEGVAALERMTPVMMSGALVQYVINYIYARLINAIAAHLHATAPTVARVVEVERTARRYIEGVVRQDMDTRAFFEMNDPAHGGRWDAIAGQRVIDRLFEESYAVVEAGLAPPAQGGE